MIPREKGFLLLSSHLGDPDRKPLTVAQFRELTRRAQQMEKPEKEREMTCEDLISIGCGREFAQRAALFCSSRLKMSNISAMSVPFCLRWGAETARIWIEICTIIHVSGALVKGFSLKN